MKPKESRRKVVKIKGNTNKDKAIINTEKPRSQRHFLEDTDTGLARLTEGQHRGAHARPQKAHKQPAPGVDKGASLQIPQTQKRP